MLKNDELAAVKRVLKNLVKGRRLFTAFDVTRLVMDDLQEHMDHSDVRPVVHQLMGDGSITNGYTRNNAVTFDVGNGSDTAEVYGPTGVSASSYDCNANTPANLARKASKSKKPARKAAPNFSAPAKTGTKSPSFDIRNADSEGRISIPVTFIVKLGARRGSKVFVAHRNNGQPGLVLLQNAPNSGLLTTLRVDSRGAVRLSPRTLTAAQIDDTAKVSLSGRVIVVLPQ